MPDPLSAHTAPLAAADPQEAIARVRRAYDQLSEQIHKVIVGQDAVVDQILMAMFCRGHALVEGVPGLAKTLLISTIARTLSLGFSRIQFTPDLMPSDITGTEVIEEDKATGVRELRFVKGPIFANVILADEINRTPPGAGAGTPGRALPLQRRAHRRPSRRGDGPRRTVPRHQPPRHHRRRAPRHRALVPPGLPAGLARAADLTGAAPRFRAHRPERPTGRRRPQSADASCRPPPA